MQQTTQYGSTLKFGEYVIFTDMLYNGFICKVYEFVDDTDDFDAIECRLNLISEKQGFEDGGHAVQWGLEQTKR